MLQALSRGCCPLPPWSELKVLEGLDRFLLSWVRQRKSGRQEREENELRNARARLERLMGEDKP